MMLTILLSIFTTTAMADEITEFAKIAFSNPQPKVLSIPSVQTCHPTRGKVVAIQVKVSQQPLNSNNISVNFQSGGKLDLLGKGTFKPGYSSQWIRLPNMPNPCINTVVLNVGASASSNRTVVSFLGQWGN